MVMHTVFDKTMLLYYW